MSQLGQGASMQPRAIRPRSNIYTALMIVAAVALAVGVGVVFSKGRTMYGEQAGPFEILSAR